MGETTSIKKGGSNRGEDSHGWVMVEVEEGAYIDHLPKLTRHNGYDHWI